MKWVLRFTFGFDNYFLIFTCIFEASFFPFQRRKGYLSGQATYQSEENSSFFCVVEMIVSSVYFNPKILFICKKCYFQSRREYR